MTARLEQLANDILQYAGAAGLTLVTAESCSAGRLATAFAKAEGAAQHFTGGLVTYTKQAKHILLGVPADMLAMETAVSAAVVEAMARGAIRHSHASLAVAITGVTGPNPDEDGNPVGLIYCAAARSDGSARHIRLQLQKGDPDRLIEQSCIAALLLLRDLALS